MYVYYTYSIQSQVKTLLKRIKSNVSLLILFIPQKSYLLVAPTDANYMHARGSGSSRVPSFTTTYTQSYMCVYLLPTCSGLQFVILSLASLCLAQVQQARVVFQFPATFVGNVLLAFVFF